MTHIIHHCVKFWTVSFYIFLSFIQRLFLVRARQPPPPPSHRAGVLSPVSGIQHFVDDSDFFLFECRKSSRENYAILISFFAVSNVHASWNWHCAGLQCKSAKGRKLTQPVARVSVKRLVDAFFCVIMSNSSASLNNEQTAANSD